MDPIELSDIEQALTQQGWALAMASQFDVSFLEDFILSVAMRLGLPRRSRNGGSVVDHLTPTEPTQARPRSLSTQYGTNAFPWHVDGAHWLIPPRYLVFGCVSASSTTAITKICDRAQILALNERGAKTHPFLVRNGPRSFYATILSDMRPFIRHDPGCMHALDANGEELQRAIEENEPAQAMQITWMPGTVAVIDNWRCLHKRMNTLLDRERHLLRVTVMER
ncbi:TauD/TfdA family dioxygenase [Chromobacterium vaccinii]|uniref:TauD/TfdA family dioxygenase n=1 Tax=Chromobacterium vaccinii TaxID=1108595 RepID=UPI00326090F2